MRYLSVCSGIEAATQAWAPLGWTPVAFSEIEPFPCAVLAHHYPGVPNWGDMTRYQEWPDADVDVLCGGTPCQSFSVAGLRKGLADPRGSLMLTFGAIAARYRPRWLVWENVPGVLSSGGGRDFGAFLGMLGELGYGWSYRVLDAQHVRTRRFPRAVPQRRRRVFVVGYLGDWRRAAAVLFDRESLSGHPAPRRRTGKDPAGNPALGFGGGRQSGPSDVATAHGHRLDWEVETFVAEPVAHALRAQAQLSHQADRDVLIAFRASEEGEVTFDRSGPLGASSPQAQAIAFSCKDHGADASAGVAPTMRAMGHGASHPNAGGQLAVAFQERGRGSGRSVEHITTGYSVRRLTSEASIQSLQAVFFSGVRSLMERKIADGDAEEAGPGKVLCALRDAYGEEAFQEWCLGVATALQAEEVLRPEVHGRGFRCSPVEDDGMVHDALSRQKGDCGGTMRAVRVAGCEGCPPPGSQPYEQRADEFGADLPKLSCEGTPDEDAVQHLWRTLKGARLLQQASDTLAKVRRPVGDENPASEEMHDMRFSCALEVALREALHAGEASGNASNPLTDRSDVASGKGGNGVYAVRRLTPRLRECERLMGFPEIRESATISVCWADKSQGNASAEAQCTTVPNSALNAADAASTQPVGNAGTSFNTSRLGHAQPVALNVRIDLERGAVETLSAGRLIWSARAAEKSGESPLCMPVADFVRLAALLTASAAKATLGGRAASPALMHPSTVHENGSWSVNLSGDEIADAASVADCATESLRRCTTSTTSQSGQNSQNTEQTLRTLSCCVAGVIASSTPNRIRPGISFVVTIETVRGYTAIPWRGRAASECPDGPRYKALGNSWAVNCAEWIGERIAEVDAWTEAA